MGKPGLGFLQPRRRSSGNVLDDADPSTHLTAPASTEQSSFRVLSRSDIEKAKQERQEQALKKAHEKTSKFGRFSAFGSSGKARTRSVDEDSPSSSNRDSKSSSGAQSFSSRPYHGGGSSSTLPSSAESDPSDNMFALPSRPHTTQHNSSPGALSMGNVKKQLPPPPASRPNDTSGRPYGEHDSSASGVGAARARATTTSSYASTAVAPKLEADLDFGDSGFDDLFSGLDRKESPAPTSESLGQPGRSLLQGRRTFQSEPIRIDRKLDIEPPPKSWDSRGSGDNLITSPVEDRSPPPVPPHKYPEYAPVASHSPELNDEGFEDEDAKLVRQSIESRKSLNAPEPNPSSTSLSAAMSNDASYASTPSNSGAGSGALRTPATPSPRREMEQGEMFGSANTDRTTIRRPLSPLRENAASTSANPSQRGPMRRVMTAAEFQLHQKTQIMQSNDDSSEDDYEDDEEDAIRKQEEQQRLIRKQQQMRIAREHMRRSTAPTEARAPEGSMSAGFPSEVSLQADEWSDEDIPLGVLAQHGFPSRNKPPSQPPNPMPSYFRSSTPSLPDRPSSTGALGNRASTYRPPFARNLPDDPFPPVMGNGLVRPSIRESMGFNNRAMSVYNEPMGGIPLEAQPQYTSLIDQIQMRDLAKQKYMGGASSKMPAAGPFTGALSSQMNAMGNPNRSTRMSVVSPMPMNGMPGMNPMTMNMNMMGGGSMQMPMMGYPMYPQNDLMMQQMYQQQQMLAFQAQNAMFAQQQMPQDPRMSMISNGGGFQHPQQQNLPQNPAFLGVGNAQQRPMSIMSVAGPQPNGAMQNRPYSTIGVPMPGFQQSSGLPNGYTPSIAPSERSNIGLSARYRPVVTGNGMGADSKSTVGSSMTLQASGGAAAEKKVKGILKNKSQGQKEDDNEEEDWGKIAQARKSKFLGGKVTEKKDDGGLGDLGDLVRGLEGL
ncbi:uncharacterized protein EI97DRAFT_428828 [Westerdykella ornata]|uniref:Uncharacterized protein n=1 Tax=Westerdykella ornata TaxID=318751 RepID=A0A6A6JVT1_WESOR|nr:uncharacterized protein EI97DRAFT_428828 [Westerdykella ornata]KAF2280720.1 hypothetical protein EI97DRAFT_428828 [Westerdykella ornata]